MHSIKMWPKPRAGATISKSHNEKRRGWHFSSAAGITYLCLVPSLLCAFFFYSPFKVKSRASYTAQNLGRSFKHLSHVVGFPACWWASDWRAQQPICASRNTCLESERTRECDQAGESQWENVSCPAFGKGDYTSDVDYSQQRAITFGLGNLSSLTARVPLYPKHSEFCGSPSQPVRETCIRVGLCETCISCLVSRAGSFPPVLEEETDVGREPVADFVSWGKPWLVASLLDSVIFICVVVQTSWQIFQTAAGKRR